MKGLPRLNKPNAQQVKVGEVRLGNDLAIDFGDGMRNFHVTRIGNLVEVDDEGNETLMHVLYSGKWMIQVPDGETMTRVGPSI